MDALAEDPNQIDKSPYAYAWNNPTNLTDPDGNCPLCGFAIGALLDYGTQVAANKLQGKDWGDALTEVDGKSILVSGTAGAIGVGIAKNIKNLGTLAKVGVEVTSDAAISATSQAINEGEVNLEDVAMDTFIGQAGRQTVGKALKEGAKNSKAGQKLQQEINRQNNIAKKGKPNTPNGKKTQANVSKAQNKLDNFTTGKAAVGSGVAAGSGRRIVKTINGAEGAAQGSINQNPFLNQTTYAEPDATNVKVFVRDQEK